MKQTFLSLILTAVLVLSLAACGDSEPAATSGSQAASAAVEKESTAEETTAEEDGQNAIMNFVGPYGVDNLAAMVEADGMTGAKVTIQTTTVAGARIAWEMSGAFDTEALTMEYDNCRKVNQEVGEDGEVASEEVAFENGKGRIVFTPDLTFTWEDDEENIADGLVFAFGYVPAEPEETVEDGQNAIMNFVGPYGAYRMSAMVEADGMTGAKVTIQAPVSAGEMSTWEMSGAFDDSTLTMEYANCKKVNQAFGEDGEVASEEVVYENGKGKIVFTPDLTFTWEDNEENVADGTVFEYAFVAPEDGDTAAGSVSAGDFIGIWECDRCSIEISEGITEGYRVLVGWGSSAWERTIWEYTCFPDETGLIASGEGTKKNLTSTEDDMEVEDVYNDGAARFDMTEEGTLVWTDLKENAGEGMIFTRMEVMTPAETDFAEDYFQVVGAVEQGTAGSSLKLAEAANAVMRFAAGNVLYAVNTQELRDNMLAAWTGLSDEERQNFDTNFLDVVALIDNSIDDWDANRSSFEGVEDLAGNMEIFIKDPAAIASWRTLRNHTFTMGNSED